MTPPDDLERLLADRRHAFWDKVDISPLHPDGCWEWNAGRSTTGYGRFAVGARYIKAHRAAYRLTHGTISGKAYVLHRCDNRLCVAPHHLYLGTHSDNMVDMHSRGRACDYRGALNPRAKLSGPDVAALRTLCRANVLSYAEAARRFGVSRAHARNIALGNRWKEQQ